MTGLFSGTAAYMSPEQARGKPVDKRTDIWAFGCVLYEMLTGKPAFPGDTVSDTISGILDQSDPEWIALPLAVPTPVRRLLHRCLEKDARRRLRDIADAAGNISTDELTRVDAPKSLPLLKRLMPIGAMGLVAAALAAATWQFAPPRTPAAAPVSRFNLALGCINPRADVGQRLAISRDGRSHRVPTRRSSGRPSTVRAFPGSDRLGADSWNRCRRRRNRQRVPFTRWRVWVGFWDVRTSALKKIRVTGGQSETICELPGEARFTTGPNGKFGRGSGVIVFSSTLRPGLFKVAETGGVCGATDFNRPLVKTHVQPHVLPDGRAVLFTIPTPEKPSMLAVLSLARPANRNYLLKERFRVQRQTAIWYFSVVGDYGRLASEPVTLGINGQVAPVLEDTGNFSNLETTTSPETRVLQSTVEPKRNGCSSGSIACGREEPLAVPPKTYMYNRISPDGTRVRRAGYSQRR